MAGERSANTRRREEASSHRSFLSHTHLGSRALIRTPKSTRRSLIASRQLLNENAIQAIHSKFFRTVCNVSCVTPLSNFDNNPVTWKRRKNKLVNLIKNSPKYPYLMQKYPGKLKVDFILLDELRGNDLDDNTLVLTVSFVHEGVSNIVYRCLLCSVEQEDIPGLDDTFTVLPLMFWYGKPFMKPLVNAFLMKTFDCHIKDMVFSAIELEWMLAMFTVEDAKSNKILMTYTTKIKELTTIDYSLDLKTVLKMMKHILGRNPRELRLEQVQEIMAGLGKHFRVLTGIELKFLALSYVDLPALTAKDSGKIKIKTPEHMMRVLKHLTSIAQGF